MCLLCRSDVVWTVLQIPSISAVSLSIRLSVDPGANIHLAWCIPAPATLMWFVGESRWRVHGWMQLDDSGGAKSPGFTITHPTQHTHTIPSSITETPQHSQWLFLFHSCWCFSLWDCLNIYVNKIKSNKIKSNKN